MELNDVVTTESALREVIGPPIQRSLQKEIRHLDAHCRALIGASPFVLIASSDASGRTDVSPLGETSVLPEASLEAMRTKGDAPMSARQWASRWRISFCSERWIGGPITSRRALSVVTTSLSSISPP